MIQLRCASPFQTGTSRTSFRVRDDIRGMELHEVGLYKEPSLAAARTADHQDIFIPGILWVLWAVRHHQPFRLGQQYIVFKYRVYVGFYILRRSP